MPACEENNIKTITCVIRNFLLYVRYTYEVGPVFVLMENEVLKKMMEFIGYTSGDGILAPGRDI